MSRRAERGRPSCYVFVGIVSRADAAGGRRLTSLEGLFIVLWCCRCITEPSAPALIHVFLSTAGLGGALHTYSPPLPPERSAVAPGERKHVQTLASQERCCNVVIQKKQTNKNKKHSHVEGRRGDALTHSSLVYGSRNVRGAAL